MQTPFASPIIQPSVIPAKDQKDTKDDDKKDDLRSTRSSSKERSDRKSRRRSRSRSRSRDRRDRSRDRRDRDRRRRDRSRSRDRRRRDRKDRSKSRERTRSKERDVRRNRDRRRDSRDDKSNDSVQVIDSPEQANQPRRPNWDRNTQRMPFGQNNPNPGVGLLGKYPGQVPQGEEGRRNFGGGNAQANNMGQQGNMLNNPDANGGFNGRREWPNKQSRFSDRLPLSGTLAAPLSNFSAAPMRPMLSQDIGFGNNQRNIFMNNMRMPFGQEMGMNRQNFLNRGMSNALQNRNDYQYNTMEMNHEEPFRREQRFESCVQVRPYYGGYGDVRRFFNGLHISNSGIKFVTDGNRKRTGTIYVRFVRPEARPQALRRSGQELRGVVVEVAPITDEDFEKCGTHEPEFEEEKEQGKTDQEETTGDEKPTNCIVVVDIPTFAKEQDILKMFSDYSLLGIHIYKENKKRNAYVQFHKEDDAERAFKEKDKHTLGGKPIVVRWCSEKMFKEAELGQALAQEEIVVKDEVIDLRKDEPDNCGENAASYDTDVILLTGIPFKTTDRDVIDFFSDIGLLPTRIHLCQGKYGQPSECYCEFSSADEAIAALDKNGMPLGNGTVIVEPFPRRDMEKILCINDPSLPMPNMPHHPPQRFPGRLGPRPMLMGLPPRPHLKMRHPAMNPYEGSFDGNNMGPPGCVLAMENVPFKATINEILEFYRNFDVNAHSILRRYNENGTCTGEARVTFNNPNECQKAFEELRFKKIRDRTIYLKIM